MDARSALLELVHRKLTRPRDLGQGSGQPGRAVLWAYM